MHSTFPLLNDDNSNLELLEFFLELRRKIEKIELTRRSVNRRECTEMSNDCREIAKMLTVLISYSKKNIVQRRKNSEQLRGFWIKIVELDRYWKFELLGPCRQSRKLNSMISKFIFET